MLVSMSIYTAHYRTVPLVRSYALNIAETDDSSSAGDQSWRC